MYRLHSSHFYNHQRHLLKESGICNFVLRETMCLDMIFLFHFISVHIHEEKKCMQDYILVLVLVIPVVGGDENVLELNIIKSPNWLDAAQFNSTQYNTLALKQLNAPWLHVVQEPLTLGFIVCVYSVYHDKHLLSLSYWDGVLHSFLQKTLNIV